MQWYEVIPLQTFDNGFGVFQANGKYVKINNTVVMTDVKSQGSVQITGNSTLSRLQTRGTYFVGDYWQLKVDFWYQSLNTAANDSFSVQIWRDNVKSWNTVRQYSRNTTGSVWTNDTAWYNGVEQFAKPSDATWIKLRIVTAINSKGTLFLANVRFDGR